MKMTMIVLPCYLSAPVQLDVNDSEHEAEQVTKNFKIIKKTVTHKKCDLGYFQTQHKQAGSKEQKHVCAKKKKKKKNGEE